MAEAQKYEAYCVKCRKKVEMKEPQIVEVKGKGGSKRKAAQGICPDCSTKVFKILGKV